MLKKDYSEGLFVVQCDQCDGFKRLPKDIVDYTQAGVFIKAHDWIIIKGPSKFENFCSDCVDSKGDILKKKKDQAKNSIFTKNAPAVIQGACFDCQGDLVLRESKFGKFYGCQRFPKCRQVVKVEYAVNHLMNKQKEKRE